MKPWDDVECLVSHFGHSVKVPPMAASLTAREVDQVLSWHLAHTLAEENTLADDLLADRLREAVR